MSKETIILIVSCLGICQALFLCLYLVTLKKGNKKANVFLALMLLGLTIRIGKSVLNVYLEVLPWQRNLGISGILLSGPFLWFYGRALLEKKKTFNSTDYLHLLPFGLFVLFCALIPNDGRPISYAIYIGIFVHLAVYIGAAVSVLLANKSVHSQLFKWYRNLIIGVGLIWVFYMGNIAGIIPLYIGGAIFFSFLIYTFSFLLLQRHDFSLEKYRGSSMDTASSKRLITTLKTWFNSEEPFLDNALTLAAVAKKMNGSPRDISRAINENENKNFSEFVNQYRIEKAKALLVDSKYHNEKIATVAYDCGFGNVTSFNLAFKSATQLTPSQYRKKFTLA